MNHQTITNEYYSNWLGDDNILAQSSPGIHFIYSNERNQIPCGYPVPFDLYVLFRNDKTIVSFGDKAKDKMEQLKENTKLPQSPEMLKQILQSLFGTNITHTIKYVFTGIPQKSRTATKLSLSDYPLYLAFFQTMHPGCNNTDWLYDYFYEMTASQLCFGIIRGGALISCTDLPVMPYLPEKVQEIGINTLETYRGKGYAADCSIATAQAIIQTGKSPQWSTESTNTPSRRLALKTGFSEFANVITVTI